MSKTIISLRQNNTILRQESNIMYESNCVQNQVKGNQKRQRESNATSQSSQQLDLEYLSFRDSIIKSQYYKSLQKQAKIRLNGWISKLDRIITNSLWKKNRNHYVKLIDLMCQCEVLITPFTSLPPHSDIPTLTKYEINAIIDQVELAVKNNTLKTQNWLKEQLKENNHGKQTPKQHWSRVRQKKQNYQKNNLKQSSIKQASSIDFSCKYSQKRVKLLNQSIDQQSIKSLPLRVINLSQKQNIKPESITFSKNINTSEHKYCEKQLFKGENILKNTQNLRIKLKIKNTQNISSSLFSQKKRIPTNHTGVSESSQPPLNFRDQHESIQMADDTLQTQVFYNQSNESFNQKDISQMNQSKLTQCNFSDEFSERCRNKQEVLMKNYFSWKNPTRIFQTNKPIMQIQMQEMQPFNFPSETIQSSNSLTIDTTLSNGEKNNLIDESKVVELSQSYQKHYWESDSVSCDFNYRQEGETIQINLCEQQEIGEEGTIRLSKHLEGLKSS